jgi:hypothetical protein
VSDLRVFRQDYQDPIGTLATPLRDHISVDTHISHLRTDFRWAGGRPINRVFVQGSQLPLQRNKCLQLMDGEWIVFIDDDMVWGADAVGRLVSSYQMLKEGIKTPIMVSGMCTRRYPPYQPTLFRARDMHEGPFDWIESWQDQDYVEVDATGCAFLLIETGVLEAIIDGPWPSMEERLTLKPWPFFEWRGSIGEDLRFCLDARRAGVRIFVDTRIPVGHVGERVFDIRDFYHELSHRTPEETEGRREHLEAIGLEVHA